MNKKIMLKIETIIAMLIVLLIGVYIYRINVIQRPLETIKNYIDEEFDEIILDDNREEISQSLDIFHKDRVIKKVKIFITVNTYQSGNIIFSIKDNRKQIKIEKVPIADLPENGWYDLPFTYEDFFSSKILTIKIENGSKEGTFGIGFCEEDINGMGDCIERGRDSGGSIVLNVSLYIKKKAYDLWLCILLPLYLFLAFGAVLFLGKKDGGVMAGRIAFCCVFLLNLIGLLITNPYVMSVPQLAENSLDFYYTPTKYGMFDVLTRAHATYMAIPQRLIAAFFIKLLGLGASSLYYMQFIAILIDSAIASSICLNIFRMKACLKLRVGLALMMFALFSGTMENTYFNFIYLGYLLIAMIICCNLDELKRYQYITLCAISAFLCVSKGFYVVMLPLAILALILFGKKNGIRKNIYFCVIGLFSAFELLYAFIFGGAGSRWFNKENILNLLTDNKIKFLLVLGVLLLIIFVYIRISVWSKWMEKLSCQEMNIITLSFLFLGSLIIGTVPYGGFGLGSLFNLFDWGGGWYIPPAIAMIILICNMMSWELPIKMQGIQKIMPIFPVLILGLCCAVSLSMTENHMGINYNCVAWDVYKDYFDETVVPVFKYDERFGTLSDDCTLWYSDFRPYDNYEYGAPYEFIPLEDDTVGDRPYLSGYDMRSQIQMESLSAVYLNYLENVGNQEVFLNIYNSSGELLCSESQITPLSSKTIGFIISKDILGAAYIDFTDKKGEKVFVERNIHIITKH